VSAGKGRRNLSVGLFLDLSTIGLILWNVWEYCRKLTKSDDKAPELATWLLFATGTSLSLATYFRFAETISPLRSALNSADVVGTSIIAIAVITYNRRHPWLKDDACVEEGQKRAEVADRYIRAACFVAAAVVALYWLKTNDHRRANIAAQLIITAAWVPTLRRLFRMRRNSEPIKAWMINDVASLLGFASGWLRNDWPVMIYTGRSFVMISILLTFTAIFERQAKK